MYSFMDGASVAMCRGVSLPIHQSAGHGLSRPTMMGKCIISIATTAQYSLVIEDQNQHWRSIRCFRAWNSTSSILAII